MHLDLAKDEQARRQQALSDPRCETAVFCASPEATRNLTGTVDKGNLGRNNPPLLSEEAPAARLR